ncbi:MAG: FxsA family protein [Actinomycetota bacterium]
MLRLLLFVGVPLVEMALLIWVGGRIGVGATLAVILLTGIAGASLVKRQGLSVWYSAQERLAMGSLPADEMVHGAMLLVAGAFLLTPGFLTDVVGFSLLVPSVREWLRRRFGARMSQRFRTTKRVEVWRV